MRLRHGLDLPAAESRLFEELGGRAGRVPGR